MSFWIQHPNLTFDEESHIYRWDNRPVPSVTGIFDSIGFRENDKKPFRPLGCPDFAKNAHDSDFGNAFHKIASAVVSGLDVTFPDEMKPWFDKLINFLSENNFIPLYDNTSNIISEYPMYSLSRRFAGTVDWIVRDADTNIIWVIDWKSTGLYQKSYSWQTAGYEMLFREVFGGAIFDKREKIIRCTVLFSPDKDKAVTVIRKNNPEDAIAFQSIFNTYKIAAQ